ncbi:alcohol dehydrogenase catalytic domain-containing protein [Oceanimonas doudoroffii]|nr:alcohol dehydrogenase [Oceanimonas doudoroffii]
MITMESLPDSMQAWIWAKSERAISLATQAMPDPGPGDVLIANKAIGLNPVDWKFIDAALGEQWSDGHIPGVDGAGVVVAVGDESLRHWLGVPVCYHQSLLRNGSFAEYTAIDARTIMRMPERMSWSEAAAFPCPVMTAWQAIEKIPTPLDAEILITGASGAVGRILVQLARARGFHITVIASGARHDSLMELGAHRCVESASQLEARYFAVFDTVGAAHAETLASYVEANGHLICIMGRLEKAVVPLFSTAISQHEVALNALHGTGSEAQWQRFAREGERLLHQQYQGGLKGPDMLVEPFERLDAALLEFKSHRKALKYGIELG